MSNAHAHDGIDVLAAAVESALDPDRFPHAAACWLEIRRRIDDLAEAIGDLDGAVDRFMDGEPKPNDDATCPDCDGTGWASESNPGTGGGTGRDEQIACPCPRGCPDLDERAAVELFAERVRALAREPYQPDVVNLPPVVYAAMAAQREPMAAVPFHECGQQVVDAATRMGEPGHDPTADWWCATCKTYLGDQEIGHCDPEPTTANIAAAIARGEMTLGLPDDQEPDDDAADMELLGLAMNDAREAMSAADFPEHVRHRLQALTEQGMVKQVAGGYAVTYLGAFHHEALASANRVWNEMATAAQGVDDEDGEDPRF